MGWFRAFGITNVSSRTVGEIIRNPQLPIMGKASASFGSKEGTAPAAPFKDNPQRIAANQTLRNDTPQL